MTDIKIRSSCILSEDSFCLALHVDDEEEPNSIILRYEAAQAEPWTRVDIPINVNALTKTGSDSFAALGNEGDVFVFEDNKAPIKETIKGAGLDADHAEGRGYMMDMANIAGTLYAVGYNQQLFKRIAKDEWQFIKDEELQPDAGFSNLHFYLINGVEVDKPYVFGEVIPKRDSKKRGQELGNYEEALESEDEARIAAARAIYFAPLPEDEGRCYHWDGAEWEDVGVPDVVIEACFIESSEKVWIGTADGLLLMGNAEDGFDDIGETDEGIVSICKFGERMIIATRDGLFEFIPNEDSLHGETVPIKPNLGQKKGSPLPLSLTAFDDVLVYVDYNLGVYHWDGADKWTHIPIPSELLDAN